MDKVEEGQDHVEVLKENSRELYEKWLATLPADSPLRADGD